MPGTVLYSVGVKGKVSDILSCPQEKKKKYVSFVLATLWANVLPSNKYKSHALL